MMFSNVIAHNIKTNSKLSSTKSISYIDVNMHTAIDPAKLRDNLTRLGIKNFTKVDPVQIRVKYLPETYYALRNEMKTTPWISSLVLH
jgi:hypothetical protein